MKKKILRLTPYILAALLFIYLIFSIIGKKSSERIAINPEFSRYISAYTSGIISIESPIRIELAAETEAVIELNKPIDKKLFSFSPGVKGEAYWIDNRTIEFRANDKLKRGTIYTIDFALGKVMDVPKEFETFSFQVQTIQQQFTVTVESFKPIDNSDIRWYRLKGMLQSSDIMDEEELAKIITAATPSKSYNIVWENHRDGRYHNFVIDSIERKESAETLLIQWDGKSIDMDIRGEKEQLIPSLTTFSVIETFVIQQPEQHILIRFSDPLLQNQDLEGLISIDGLSSLKMTIEDNEVRVYPSIRQMGTYTLTVSQGIKNILNYPFPQTQQFQILFESIKPQIKLVGTGVILPSSEGLIFPFQAVNVKAVEVKIIRIFENNVGFFLQTNSLSGNNELKRAGRMVLKKTVQLGDEKSGDLGRWNTYFLDLAQLIQQEPGAIYRVELSFSKKHSCYSCPKTDEQEEEEQASSDEDEDTESEVSYWDSYEYGYYDDYGYGDYDYNDRDNPCSDSYYYYNRGNTKVARNLVASDIGIIAKGGTDKSMTFAVTDIRTTQPLSGVTLEVYDYQRQLIITTTTDGEGLASVTVERQPFLLIAKQDKQRGYLKLDKGSSLSLSTFDVSGALVQKGIKGFIYGERGVWRPGDTLFLHFILEDKAQKLPANHPVSFELRNPSGQLTKKLIKTVNTNGFYSFVTATETDAPTGNWTATVKAGGAVFSKVLKIETVKPNRLKIAIDFGTEILSVNDKLAGQLSVKWLHGAIARNVRVQAMVSLSAVPTVFPKYKDYVFDDPTKSFSSEEQNIFDGHTNEDGEVTINASINSTGDAGGMLKAGFNIRAYEEGGDYSVDRFSLLYSPYPYYIGICPPQGDRRNMLLTDTSHVVSVVTLDEKGNPVNKQNLMVKVYKLNWSWWWDASANDLGNFSSSSYQNIITSTSTSTTNGKGTFSFKIKYPDWGRYLIQVSDPQGGHSSGKIVYVDWPGWAGKAERGNPSGASMLTFTTDKDKYKTGDKATVTFPTSGQGRALVSIETGTKVLKAYWVEAKENETRFTFDVTPEMAPNCYLHLTYVQPHLRKNNDMPIRMYGVMPLMVDDEDTHLYPEISMPDVIRSESTVEIKVKEKNNKAMTYTLSIVDEGLLDLTRYRTPNPWTDFYAREALGVRTWDLYDMIVGAYGGTIEQLFSIGGDDELRGKEGAKTNRFKPVVKVLGPFYLSGGTDKHVIKMPPYVGSVKAMVVAGHKGAYGCTEKAVPVRNPLMVIATLPRVLGPGEEVKLPVTVFAMENAIKNVKVQVAANDMFTIEQSNADLRFNKTGDETIIFSLKVKSKLGAGKVKIIATSGAEKAQTDIDIEIRNPNPKLIETYEKVIDGGNTQDIAIAFKGMPGTNKATLEVSNIPPIDLERRLKYLLEYPHGCVEQTTSGAFPQLFLADVLELKVEEKTRAEENVKAAINRLSSFILPEGSFSYWPGQSSATPWGTSYAGHFLLEAEKKGYDIPSGFKSNFIKYQKKVARSWEKIKSSEYYYYMSDLEQAYRLYTLALAGDPDMGSMNRLRNLSELSVQAQWRLAAAYALAGQAEIAKQLTQSIVAEVKPYTALSYTYGSEERDWAMILETMTLLNMREKAASVVKKLSERLSSSYWLSTQSTAYALMSISKFAKTGSSQGALSFTYKYNNGQSIKASTKMSIAQVKLDASQINSTLSITNSSKGVLFVRVITEGLPEAGDPTEYDKEVQMNIDYQDMKGNGIDVSRITQGTDFQAVVTVRNKSVNMLFDMALSQIFASGWEITTSRLNEGDLSLAKNATYQDIRDDRVYTYFNLGYSNSSLSTKTFVIRLNAAYLGKFYLPSVSCEAMYNASISSRKAGRWVEVVAE